MRTNQHVVVFVFILSFLTLSSDRAAWAQLQITEILYQTAADRTTWEWFEVRNAGKQTFDLNGFVLDDFHITLNARSGANIVSVDSGGQTATTIPSGGVAIIYNGRQLEFDESRFRTAWNLNSSVPLIGVDGFPSLNDSGDAFGLWSSFEGYGLDLANTDEDDALEVATFDEAVAWIDYGTEDFPTAENATIEWNGIGDYRDGSNWSSRTAESQGVTSSIETFLPTSPVNSDEDIGNPGIVLGEGEATSLVITELMYNPDSSEPSEWEWIEVFNGTGAVIDFEQTPYFVDDLAGTAISEANISTGTIADGELAILFRSSVPVENMAAAWGEDLNLIPVGSWPGLNSGGDTVGIWSDADAYNRDSPSGEARTFVEAIATVSFVDGGEEGWPNISEGQSINVLDLEGNPNDPNNWAASTPEDGSSRTPEIVLSSNLVDNAGGDLATPGTFGDVVVEPRFDLDLNGDGSVNQADAALLCTATTDAGLTVAEALAAGDLVTGDFDLNGEVAFNDFLTLANNFGELGAEYGQGDANCDGSVVFNDFLIHADNFGAKIGAAHQAVPEPTGRTLLRLAMLLLPLSRGIRRGRDARVIRG